MPQPQPHCAAEIRSNTAVMSEQLQRALNPLNPAAFGNDGDQVFHTSPSSSCWRSRQRSEGSLFSNKKAARQEAKHYLAIQATTSAVYFHFHFDASISYKDSSEDC